MLFEERLVSPGWDIVSVFSFPLHGTSRQGGEHSEYIRFHCHCVLIRITSVILFVRFNAPFPSVLSRT